jgi:predicted PurR-regulated permease PerM
MSTQNDHQKDITETALERASASDNDVAASGMWTVRHIMLTTLAVFGVAVGFLLLYRFYMVVFLFFFAIALKVALDPAVNWLLRRSVHREIGVLVVYLVLSLAMAGVTWIVAPLLIDEGQAIIRDLPEYYQEARAYLLESGIGLLRGVATLFPSTITLPALAAMADTAAEPGQGWRYAGLVFRIFLALFGVFALAYYWMLEGGLLLRRLVLRAPAGQRSELRALIAEIEAKIGSYFRGQLILCVIVGLLSMIAFLLLGVPNALLLGVLMGIFEAIPVIGPTLGAVPAIVFTLASAPEMTLWVIGALIAIQVAENNFLVPRIMGGSVGVNAVVTLLAIAAFGGLFGVAGAILAIPLAAILQILLDRLLFNTPLNTEANPSLTDTQESGRGQIDVWRLEAQHLAQAAREGPTGASASEFNGAPLDLEAEQTADDVESIAVELNLLLAQVENA